jgi:superfamily II DNA or RNA helicase
MNIEKNNLEANVKNLYPYQLGAINTILSRLLDVNSKGNILFQLPTGGGKTIIFSEIAKRFIAEKGQKVLILTHRIELSVQTSKALSEIKVSNFVINRDVKEICDQTQYHCFVAMVETLNNRLNDNEKFLDNIGLVIIDEAHYNSFRKLFKHFKDSTLLGVTATPLSSNRNLPLNEDYQTLLVGESIADLVEKKYLSKAATFSYNVNLKSLKVGPDGDYTISSLDRLYSMGTMQDKLISAYEERALKTKTLIFNSGIVTSIKVFEVFKAAGYDVKHLDSTFSPKDRRETLEWFKETPSAVLTSVGILTTGFDEPTVETIILNRATRSLTLYHQMIGRGSRILPTKDSFTILDLGNNHQRLGLWQEYINWLDIFLYPNKYFDRIAEREQEFLFDYNYERPLALLKKFAKNTDADTFNMRKVYLQLINEGLKANNAIELSIKNHSDQIIKNAADYSEARELIEDINEEIEYRVRVYCNCLSKATQNYFEWLTETYKRKLSYILFQSYS